MSKQVELHVCEQCGKSVHRTFPYDDRWRGEIELCAKCFENKYQASKRKNRRSFLGWIKNPKN